MKHWKRGILLTLLISLILGTALAGRKTANEYIDVSKISSRNQIRVMEDSDSLYEKIAKENRYSFGSTDMKDLHLRREITQKDVEKIGDIDSLKELYFHIKDSSIDLSPLAELPNLKMITLIDTDISDIEPLTELKNLDSLVILGNENMQIKEQAEKYFTDVEIYISEDIPYPY